MDASGADGCCLCMMKPNGAAGDQVDHLMYRLQRRELLKRHPPKVSVLLIGTNDLGAASCFPGGAAPIVRAANPTAQR